MIKTFAWFGYELKKKACFGVTKQTGFDDNNFRDCLSKTYIHQVRRTWNKCGFLELAEVKVFSMC